jgi:hypothetical protein
MRFSSGRLPTLLGLSALCLCACQGDADFSDAAPKPIILNADDDRQEITDIDRLVFSEQPLHLEQRATLARKLEELSKRVKAFAGSRFIDIEALEIQRLAGWALSLPNGPQRTEFQNQWMRIRSNLFDDRSWFARSAADLERVSRRSD